MAYSEKRLDKDGLLSRAQKYNENYGGDMDTGVFFDRLYYLDNACVDLDEALAEAGLEGITPVGYTQKRDKIKCLGEAFESLAAIPTKFCEQYREIEENFRDEVSRKATASLLSVSLEDIFYNTDVEAMELTTVSKITVFDQKVRQLEQKVKKTPIVTQIESDEEYAQVTEKIATLEVRNEQLASVLRGTYNSEILEELNRNREKIDACKEYLAKSLVKYAESGVDLSEYEVTDEIIQRAGSYMNESTNEKVTKALAELYFSQYAGDTLDEQIHNALSGLEASEGNALPVDVYDYMVGNKNPEAFTDLYTKYTDSEKYMIALHMMTAENLRGNEMPRWWMEKYLTLPPEFVPTEENVSEIMHNSSGIKEYYLGTYCIIDMLSGMGNQSDGDGNYCSGQRIYDSIYESDSMPLYVYAINPWKEYMFGAMYDYVNNIPSVRANKYILTEKFGYPDNKETYGVYNVYTSYPTSLYEAEIDAYLSQYEHKDNFYNSMLQTNPDPNKQLRMYFEADFGDVRKLTDEEKEFLISVRNSEFYDKYGCTEYQDKETLYLLLKGKTENAIVTMEGNNIIITPINGEGEPFVFSFSATKSIFGTTYISGEEYFEQMEAFANYKSNHGMISEKDTEKYKKEYEEIITEQYGEEAVLKITAEDYERYVKLKAAGAVLEDTYINSKVRKVDKFTKVKNIVVGTIGIGACLIALLFPGTTIAAICGITASVSCLADGVIRVSQGDVEEGRNEVVLSTISGVCSFAELCEVIDTKETATVIANAQDNAESIPPEYKARLEKYPDCDWYKKVSIRDKKSYAAWEQRRYNGVGNHPGMTASDYDSYIYGINKLDERLAIEKIDCDEYLKLKQKNSVPYQTSYGKSTLKSLKNTENFTDSAIEHIFEGNIRRGTAGGYHYECIEDTAGSVIPGTEKLLNDFGVYKAQVKVNNIPKTGNGGYSTFYPKDLSPQEVIDSINEAYANRTFVKGSRNSYVGVSNRGLIIEMYINKEGKIISAFPKE